MTTGWSGGSVASGDVLTILSEPYWEFRFCFVSSWKMFTLFRGVICIVTRPARSSHVRSWMTWPRLISGRYSHAFLSPALLLKYMFAYWFFRNVLPVTKNQIRSLRIGPP